MKFKTEIRSSQKGKLRLISQSRYSFLMGVLSGIDILRYLKLKDRNSRSLTGLFHIFSLLII